MRSFIILLFLPLICSAAFGQVKNFEPPNPRARQAARCSFVATLEAFSDDSEKTKVFAKNLMKLSVKLGATQAQVGEWTAGFFSDLKAATLRSAPEEAPADPKFIGREINICTNFLDEQHGKSKAPPSE